MITLKNVTKEYHLDDRTSITPVQDVSLEVERGEFVMIVGRSGSGKTTLLNLCAGLVKPTSGQVLIDGKDIQGLDEKALTELRSKKIGYVLQSASMLPSLSVIENVAVPAMFSGDVKPVERVERAAQVLQMVGLGERMDVLPKQLSGGELRRVAIARALLNRPEILLADEPTADLDEQTERVIVSVLQKIHRSGVTVLMVTHNLDLVPYATRALKMEGGKLVPFDGAQTAVGANAPEAAQAAVPVRMRVPDEDRGWRALMPVAAIGGVFALVAALAVMTLAFGITLGKVNDASSNSTSGATSQPGPVMPGDMDLASGALTYNGRGVSGNAYNGIGMGMGGVGSTGMAGIGMGTGAAATGIYDPPPGGAFKDLPYLQNTSTEPGVFRANLEAKQAQVDLAGVKANLLTYNGSYPGPIIKVKRGDTLKLDFLNSLPATGRLNMLGTPLDHTNLHTHGLHVSPKAPSDNVMIDLAPGQSFNYEYDLSKQPASTLNFIHGHVHHTAAEQLWAGMVSPVLVEDEVPALAAYESHVMVLKDIALNGAEPMPHLSMMDWMAGMEGDIVTVNGQVNPVLTMKPGQVQRWRILNASNARFYQLQVENLSVYLVGTDGGLLDRPYPVSTVLVSPGERVDVLVKAISTTGNYRVMSLPYYRGMGMGMMGGGGMTGGNGMMGGMGMYGTNVYGNSGLYNSNLYGTRGMNGVSTSGMMGGQGYSTPNMNLYGNAATNGYPGGYGLGGSGMGSMGGMMPCPMMGMTGGMGGMGNSTAFTLMTVAIKGSAASDDIPAVVDPAAKRMDIDLSALPKRTLVLQMGMGVGGINGQVFGPDAFTISSQLGTYEVWQVINGTMMDHPFHVHVNAFQVLSVVGGDPDYGTLYTTAPAWKDTVIVPKGGSVTLLVPVQDYEGMTMFHCHILEHEDIGMMGVWEIGGGAAADTPAGSDGSSSMSSMSGN